MRTRYSPKRALALFVTIALGAAVALGFNTSFNRSCSVTGGSAQQLSAVMTACGYTGAVSLNELAVINPSAAAGNLYVGQSDVSAANGVELLPGQALSFNAASQQDTIETGRIYLFVSSTQNAQLSARSK